MKKIELKNIKEWEEKKGNRPTGSIRIYVGELHVGTCMPYEKWELRCNWKDEHRGKYVFTALTHDMTSDNREPRTLEEIKIDIECTIKEFLGKFLKSYKTLKPVSQLPKVMYCDHCDGTGTCEGGKGVMLSKCEKCNGSGIVPYTPLVMSASPNKQFHSDLKRDGQGKRLTNQTHSAKTGI